MLRCRKAGVDVPHILLVEEAPAASWGVVVPQGGAPIGAPENGEGDDNKVSFLGAPLGAPDGCGRILMEWIEGCTVKSLLDLFQQQAKQGSCCCSEARRDQIIARKMETKMVSLHSSGTGGGWTP